MLVSFIQKMHTNGQLRFTIYLDEKARGKGVGEKLYSELEKQLYDRGICRLTSCIAYPDEGSISFHEKRGFRKVAHFEKVG